MLTPPPTFLWCSPYSTWTLYLSHKTRWRRATDTWSSRSAKVDERAVGCRQIFLWSSKCSHLKPPRYCSGLFLPCYKSVTCIRTGLHTDRLPLELGGRQRRSLKRQCVKQPDWGSRRLGCDSQRRVAFAVTGKSKRGSNYRNTDCCDRDNKAILRSSIAEPLRWVMLLIAYANVATFGTFVFLNTDFENFFITLHPCFTLTFWAINADTKNKPLTNG